MNRSHRLMQLLAAWTVLAAAGCSILPQPEPVELLDPRIQPPDAGGAESAWTLNVARPESDPMRDSVRVLVRTGPGQLQVHPSARWVAAAPDLFRTLLVRYMRDGGQLARVSAGGAASDRTLALDLRAFELAESATGELEAEIRIEARLHDTASADLLGSRIFQARESVDGSSAASVVAGFERALDALVPSLAGWVVAPQPAAGPD